MKKLKHISIWAGASLFMLSTVSYSVVKREDRICKQIDIVIDHDSELYFVTADDVLNKIKAVHPAIIGMQVGEITTDALETSVKKIPEIKNVQIYYTPDGILKVTVTQRRPIVRVIPRKGAGFYIDSYGYLMPLSQNYAARVPVVNGNVMQKFRNVSMPFLNAHDSLKSMTLFDEIYLLASYIDASPFWKAQIQQVYVNENQEFSLIPRVGNHNIELGNTTNLEEKFNRLMIFYKEGLPYSNWNLYQNISLKFDNQVVCTYKDTPL